jgi:hypothetical protein
MTKNTKAPTKNTTPCKTPSEEWKRSSSLFVRIKKPTLKAYQQYCFKRGLSQSYVAEEMINEFLSHKKGR